MRPLHCKASIDTPPRQQYEPIFLYEINKERKRVVPEFCMRLTHLMRNAPPQARGPCAASNPDSRAMPLIWSCKHGQIGERRSAFPRDAVLK